MDGKAYCDVGTWGFVLDGLGKIESQLRDRRYDAVIHLVTAAHGAEKYYTLQQAEQGEVSARTETVDEAQAQDDKTCQVWVGHEHLFIIDNSTNFRQKIDRAVDRVFKTVGESVHGHQLRKIRLPFMSSQDIVTAATSAGVSCQVFICSTTFVSPTLRIRKRSNPDYSGAAFHLQEFREDKNSKLRRLREQLISSHDYMHRLHEAHVNGWKTADKELVCFTWQGVVYEVNVFRTPKETCILEVEAESRDVPIDVPSFLPCAPLKKSHTEVTFNSDYDTRNMASAG